MLPRPLPLIESAMTFPAGGAGSQFFSFREVRSDAYRVSASDKRQRNEGNWPQPFGLQCKSGHTSLSASTLEPPKPSASVSSGPIFTCNAARAKVHNRLFAGLLVVALALVPSQLAAQTAAPVLPIDGLGKGAAPLDGPWQFHLGDDPAFALPQTADVTGANGWEQLSADNTWGAQGHPAYVGYAWYRKHLHFSPAPGAPAHFYLLIRHIDDVYEVYWNGQLVGHDGTFPPKPSWPYNEIGQITNLGNATDGVLAIRVWKAPLTSFDSDQLGGLSAVPVAGNLLAITALKTELDYAWLRGRQYYFGLQSLYALMMILSLLAWLRNRSQRVLLAMATFSGSPIIGMFLTGLRLPISYTAALAWLQPVLSMQDIGLWFLLLYLLDLDGTPRIARFTRNIAIVSFATSSLDAVVASFFARLSPQHVVYSQLADAVLTVIFTLCEVMPIVLIVLALRKRLDASRWFLAAAAFASEWLSVSVIALSQGSRYTHWTIGDRLSSVWFHINGNGLTPQTVANTILLLAIIYAVYRYMQSTLRRQGAMEQELKSAQELQQILIPEQLPELAGYAVTSAYRPAQEVGGDFFQIIPLDCEFTGSTLVLLGDVSGKGLKAAMTVSLIVGAARTTAKFLPHPAEVLGELNLRLCGRQQGGFTTCLALRLDPDGHCVVASAGHPAPYINKTEIPLQGMLPLGIEPGTVYQETSIDMREGDRLALYTDGLLEARNARGEIFSFERLSALFATRPDAAEATQVAVHFGQDDDITVLTLTRLATGEQSKTLLTAPALSPV